MVGEINERMGLSMGIMCGHMVRIRQILGPIPNELGLVNLGT